MTIENNENAGQLKEFEDMGIRYETWGKAHITREDELYIEKESRDRALRAMAAAFKSFRPSINRTDFIERTVQSLASGYTYGQTPNYYKIAKGIWEDHEAFWNIEENEAKDRLFFEQWDIIKKQMMSDLIKARLFQQLSKKKETKVE